MEVMINIEKRLRQIRNRDRLVYTIGAMVYAALLVKVVLDHGIVEALEVVIVSWTAVYLMYRFDRWSWARSRPRKKP